LEVSSQGDVEQTQFVQQQMRHSNANIAGLFGQSIQNSSESLRCNQSQLNPRQILDTANENLNFSHINPHRLATTQPSRLSSAQENHGAKSKGTSGHRSKHQETSQEHRREHKS